MPTLDKLRKLGDGEFHSLCDDLLCRVEVRYGRLRSHGINQYGVSIVGQPDSYVGETASSCSIAFCYTAQQKGWWNKVVDDVNAAVATARDVAEIVIAIPHNADRDGPQKKHEIDWLGAARKAAGRAELRIVDGRDIAAWLDSDYQDLRFQYLGIPYSRLNPQSLLASCLRWNGPCLAALESSTRYDPGRYISRHADAELFALWQSALRPRTTDGNRTLWPIRLIPLVSDAGIGKTSVLATFVRSVGAAVPVILLQARDLSFDTEDSLITHVMDVMQGVLSPKVRLEEESAVVHHLSSSAPLTVVLDGLDESKDSGSVQRAITHWLKSRLGQASVLIVSSRPDFWRRCVDVSWTRWMNAPADEPRLPAKRADSFERRELSDGIQLPDRFTKAELDEAWQRAGRSGRELDILPAESKEELRHPFTLRVYLDLCTSGCHESIQVMRASLLETWLNQRLDAEVSGRLSRDLFQMTLRWIAKRLGELSVGSLAVDEMGGVPRFNAANPPGEVVERLIHSNILESVSGRRDHVRFAVESVQDFYRAEAELGDVVAAPRDVAEKFARLPFTEAYGRLARLGQLLVNVEERHEFIDGLGTADARMAAVVLRADPKSYGSGARKRVCEQLGDQIESRHRVRGAFAIKMLSELPCDEARDCLASKMLHPAEPHRYLRNVSAMSFAKLGLESAVELVYEWPWFNQSRGYASYYDRETFAVLRSATPEFKNALATHAWSHVSTESGTEEHGRAVGVLAYLGDERLASHLKERLQTNGGLEAYENDALFALGTDEAGSIFYDSAKAMLAETAALGYGVGTQEWYSLYSKVSTTSGDRQDLLTQEFEPYIRRLIVDDDQEAFSLGFGLAIRSRCSAVIYDAVRAWAKQYYGGTPDWIREWIPPATWCDWWNRSNDLEVRQRLLQIIPNAPNANIEQVLIDCLNHVKLRSQAAWHLGHFGCVRAVVALRHLLDREGTTAHDKEMIGLALGLLRDTKSIDQLRACALVEPPNHRWASVLALGLIGTADAEAALVTLFDTDVDDELVGGALIGCGSATAVSHVVKSARAREDGARWFCECMKHAFWTNNRRLPTEYYSYVQTTEITAYLEEIEKEITNKWDLLHAVREIDSEDIRALLRRWASRADSADDPVVRENKKLEMSALCYGELMRRGDEFAVPYVLDERADDKDHIYVPITHENLSHFPSSTTAIELRNRLDSARDKSTTVRLLALLGRFGDSSDADLIRPFLADEDDFVSNVACETLLRLTDPLLVPKGWREL